MFVPMGGFAALWCFNMPVTSALLKTKATPQKKQNQNQKIKTKQNKTI